MAQKNIQREKESLKRQEEVRSRPAGWDEDDEYLEMMQKQKKPSVKIEQLDKERIQFDCPKCKYKVTFNTIKRHPSSCPYCGVKFKV